MKTQFISATKKYCELYNHINAPYIRKSFTLKTYENAELQICGLGFYDLFINGKKITKGKLSPYISNPDHIIYYDKYDVSPFVKTGENVIGIILGNGFLNNIGGHPWGFDKADFRSAPKVSFVLSVDGKPFLYSDETCKTAPSPITFDDLRCGEYYDSRLEQKGWNDVNFDDSAWSDTFRTKAPKGEPKLCVANPVKIINEIKPVSFFNSDGGYIFDFGENLSGICRLKFTGVNGQKIILWHFETLVENHGFYNKNTCTPDFDRNLSQKDIFICNGEDNVYEPSFTYHGFRYVFVEGIYGNDISRFTLTKLVFSSDLKQVGTFECSNETVNKLQKITINSDISNFVYFPTDCPQREKNGWTADAALSCEQFLYNFDCSDDLCVWLENIRKAQRENGQLPGVVPTVNFGYSWGNGPAWDMVATELPYQIYRFTGNKNVLTDNSDMIIKYLNYLSSKRNSDGLIAFGLPDWCECGRLTEGACSTPLEVSDSLVSIEICKKATFIFDVLNEKKNKRFANALLEDLKTNFRKKHVGNDLFVNCRSQTAQAKALSVGIFSDDEKQQAVNNLVELIKEKGNRFYVGVIGARVLFRVLADNGYADLALEIMTKNGFPSYKYWLDNGATSLWEAFNELNENSIFRKDGGRILSLNHHFWGDISSWFYRYILGINVNPNGTDPLYFEIDPAVFSKTIQASGSYIRNGLGIIIERNGKILTVKPMGDVKVTFSNHCIDNFAL